MKFIKNFQNILKVFLLLYLSSGFGEFLSARNHSLNSSRRKSLKKAPVKEEVISVVQFNRHGARTSKNYSKNLLENHFMGFQLMNLSANGYLQHQRIGQILKQKYSNLLADLKNFQIITSPVQRTIFSALGFLSGAFPGKKVNLAFQKDIKEYEYPKTKANLSYLKDNLPIQGEYFYDASKINENTDKDSINLYIKYIFHHQNCFHKDVKVKLLFEDEKEKKDKKDKKKEETVENEDSKKKKEELIKDFPDLKISKDEKNSAVEVLSNEMRVFEFPIGKKDDEESKIIDDGILKSNYESFSYHFEHLLQNKDKIKKFVQKYQTDKDPKFSNFKDVKIYTDDQFNKALNIYRKWVILKWWPTRYNLNNFSSKGKNLNVSKAEILKVFVQEFFIYLKVNLLENKEKIIEKKGSAASQFIASLKDNHGNLISGSKETEFLNRTYEEGKIYSVFSGHDTNIINILTNLLSEKWIQKYAKLENYKMLIVPYAANLIFELVKKEDKAFVRIVYLGKILKAKPDGPNQFSENIKNYSLRTKNPEQDYEIPEDGLIPFDKFIEIIDSRISNLDIDCTHPEGSDT